MAASASAFPIYQPTSQIIQEAAKNIEHHGLATRAELELRRKDQTLTLEICDNGNGFDIEALPSQPNRNPAVTCMKEYTKLSDGRFSLRTSPTRGTCIELAWDLANQHNC